ncbi:MAG: hypothetical protein ACMUEL_07090 [Flavobacteriales bacterium Tduv]
MIYKYFKLLLSCNVLKALVWIRQWRLRKISSCACLASYRRDAT